MGTTTIYLDSNPVIGHALVHSLDKTHVLGVTVDLTWLLFLNILSLNSAATLIKPLRLTRFRRSYVNRPAVVLTNHCSKLPSSTFLQLFVPNSSAFALLSTPVAQML